MDDIALHQQLSPATFNCNDLCIISSRAVTTYHSARRLNIIMHMFQFSVMWPNPPSPPIRTKPLHPHLQLASSSRLHPPCAGYMEQDSFLNSAPDRVFI